MEWLPKLYDSADSAWFEMRMHLAAVSWRRAVLVAALIVLLVLSPVYFGVAILAGGAILMAAWTGSLVRRPKSAALQRRLAAR